ncbi:hypothetical protein [Clostridium oceanicum]|uniref:Uncharacterized protein n=1 Tax=Clostridium oceanicum TaxID=1543 RepID=A0ABP3UZ25_9CLOT
MKKGLVISLRGFVDFIPLIFLWSMPNHKGILGAFISSFILLIIKGLKKDVGIMVKVVFIYLAIINILYFNFNIEGILKERYITSYGVMAAMSFVSIKMYRPFTMDISKKDYKAIKDSPLFIEMNIIISKIFGVTYLINTILSCFKKDFLSIISPILIIIPILASIILPRFMPEI